MGQKAFYSPDEILRPPNGNLRMTRDEVTAGMNRVILREPHLCRGDRRISERLLVEKTNSQRGWAPFILNEDEGYTTKQFDCVYHKAEPLDERFG